MNVTHSECAGQAQLVRDIKRKLDAALDDSSCAPSLNGPVSVAVAKDLALQLACEIETFEMLCKRCGGW